MEEGECFSHKKHKKTQNGKGVLDHELHESARMGMGEGRVSLTERAGMEEGGFTKSWITK